MHKGLSLGRLVKYALGSGTIFKILEVGHHITVIAETFNPSLQYQRTTNGVRCEEAHHSALLVMILSSRSEVKRLLRYFDA